MLAYYIMNRKAAPYYLNGQKFVILADLPSSQVDRFAQWITTHTLKGSGNKRNGGVEMAAYEDYDFWFEQHYLTEQDIDLFL